MNHFNRNTSVLAGVAALCVAVLPATQAFAASPDDAPATSVPVRYTGADLAQPGGAESLHRRIEAAARHACEEPDIRNLEHVRVYERCVNDAVNMAVAKVNATSLTAFHRSKTQRSAAG